MKDQGASGNAVDRLVKESCGERTEGSESVSLNTQVYTHMYIHMYIHIHIHTQEVTVPLLQQGQTLPLSSHRLKHSRRVHDLILDHDRS